MAESTAPPTRLSFVLPAYNEAASVGRVVTHLRTEFPGAEILVVDDSSADRTREEAEAAGARVLQHRYNIGNGAAIKTGARNATGEVIVFMDADGQHDAADVRRLLERLDSGFDMVVGARNAGSQANTGRWLGNNALNRIASLMTGRKIPDLTSGFRAARADVFRQFLYLLPNGFSYPTTCTMAFLRSGFSVDFIPIKAHKRVGRSKINFIRDGIRFLVIIMKVTTLFSPMRVFLPLGMLFFVAGVVRYLYFYLTTHQFSQMAGVMFITAMVVFLIGLISEQITAIHFGLSSRELHRSKADDKNR